MTKVLSFHGDIICPGESSTTWVNQGLITFPRVTDKIPQFVTSWIDYHSAIDRLGINEGDNPLECSFISFCSQVAREYSRQRGFPYKVLSERSQPGKLIKQEAILWGRLWDLVEKTVNLRPGSDSPEVIFYHLMMERRLTLIMFRHREDIATNIEKEEQSINKKLMSCENPFNEDREPCTFSFVEYAIQLTESKTHENFQQTRWNPFLRERMKLVTIQREQAAKVFVDGRQKRQGRKKTKP